VRGIVAGANHRAHRAFFQAFDGVRGVCFHLLRCFGTLRPLNLNLVDFALMQKWRFEKPIFACKTKVASCFFWFWFKRKGSNDRPCRTIKTTPSNMHFKVHCGITGGRICSRRAQAAPCSDLDNEIPAWIISQQELYSNQATLGMLRTCETRISKHTLWQV